MYIVVHLGLYMRKRHATLKELDGEIATAKKIDDDPVGFTAFALDYVKQLKENWWTLDYRGMKSLHH